MSKLAILCSGQGMQYPDMIQKLMSYTDAAKELAAIQDNNILSAPVVNWLQGKQQHSEIIYNNRYAQELIGLYQLLVWKQLQEAIPTAHLFAGYSAGEVAAYGCSGTISTESTLRLLRKRAEIMSDQAPEDSGMLAVKGLPKCKVSDLCESTQTYIAIENPNNHFILAGCQSNIHSVAKKLNQAGAEKVVSLKVSVPSHCPLMTSASNGFEAVMQDIEYKRTAAIILAGINGRRVYNRQQAIKSLSSQISHPVMWQQCIRSMAEYGCTVFLELGPGHALSRMVLEELPSANSRSVDEFNDINEIPKWIQKKMSC